MGRSETRRREPTIRLRAIALRRDRHVHFLCLRLQLSLHAAGESDFEFWIVDFEFVEFGEALPRGHLQSKA